MSDDGTQARAQITGAIQAANPFTDPESILDGVVTGWVLVTEWMTTDGGKWLSKTSADAAGEMLPLWQERGYLHDALFGDWPTAEGDG